MKKYVFTGWFLESLVVGGKRLRLPIYPLPFRIGRRHGLDLTLPQQSVSKEHAEIYQSRETLRIRDLRSTNGTYVNRKRIDDASIHEGDIIHVADFEFLLGRKEAAKAPTAGDSEEERTTAVLASDVELPCLFVEGTQQLAELLRSRAVTPVFQPIVRVPEGSVAAYEVLGRGCHPHLPESPRELFRIASSVGVEADLSRLFRAKAMELVGHRNDLPALFLNSHPSELEAGMSRALSKLRELSPHQSLVLEIHESAQADARTIANLRALLYELHIGLAYDDFRISQSRLLEMAEAPPDYLKFDKRFVHGIERAPASKRRLLTSLVVAARDLMVRTIAQGVETEAEAEVCSKIGFTHAQGEFFGSPVPLEELEPLAS